jgi:diadenylate cyclase
MDLQDYFQPQGIVFLRSRSKEGALRELVEAVSHTTADLDSERAFQAVWTREGVVSSWIAPGVAVPHGRVPGMKGFHLGLGRSRQGITYDSMDGRPVHILFLILGSAAEPDRHLELLAEVARLLRSETVRDAILAARNRKEIYEIILGRQRLLPPEEETATALSRLLLAHAVALVAETGARALILHLDALGGPEILHGLNPGVPLILVTQRKIPFEEEAEPSHHVIQVPYPGLSRTSQLTLSLLLALSQGLVGRQDRIVSLLGIPQSGVLDTLSVVDVAREIPSLLPATATGFLGDVRPQVLERVLQVATALTQEGREGRPVGTLFVVGDFERVRRLSHQLVMNPFQGYAEEEKNILDPSLEETIKEFSTFDGAFLLRGDGVIEAAGAYLKPLRTVAGLPSGLGARHSAAAGITAQTDSLSVAVSQSTGRVSLFKGGRLLMSLERPKP